jgi:hypothetical protein
MSTTPTIVPSDPDSTKNDTSPHPKYTAANRYSFWGDVGRRPTWPSGAEESGRAKGPTRLGKIDLRSRGVGGGVDPFLGVTRPRPLRLLSFATTETVLRDR